MAFRFNIFTGTLDIVGSSSSGGVNGIAPTAINHIATWVDTTASTIQNSLALVQPGGAIEAQGYISQRTVSGVVTVNTGESWIAPSLTIAPGGLIVLNPDAELIII
jgi:hypothetical protein